MAIRLIFDHRSDLVVERTRVINRLRWHLLELCPELERSLGRGSLNQSRVLDRVDRRLRQLGTGARVRVAREQVARNRSLNGQIDALKRELRVLVAALRRVTSQVVITLRAGRRGVDDELGSVALEREAGGRVDRRRRRRAVGRPASPPAPGCSAQRTVAAGRTRLRVSRCRGTSLGHRRR